MYRVELLIASDKGKKVLMNVNAIPKSSGMDMKKWQYFFESSPFMWYDPEEEGLGTNDTNSVAKVVDLSLASDINKYIQLAEYLKTQAAQSVGISPQTEGQITPDENVGNVQQSIAQTTTVLEPYFELHNNVKKNVLQALIETAKVAYSQSQPQKLSYFLDDMSKQVINMDINLLENNTIGLFISNSQDSEDILQSIRQLTHAALQNGKAELSDVLSILRQKGLIEAEETLKAAETKRNDREDQAQQQQQQSQQEMIKAQAEAAKLAHDRDLETIVVKEKERRETEIIKASLMAASFNPDEDKDNDGINDFVELARDGLKADIRRDELNFDRDKLAQDKTLEEKKIKLEEKKIKSKK